MPIPKKLLKHLEKNKIEYEIIEHKTVYTAYDLAATTKIKLKKIAKNLLVKFNKPFENGTKPYALAIIPADKNLDLKKITKVASMWAVELNKKLRLKKPEKNRKQLIDIYNKIRKTDIPKEKLIKDKFKINPGSMSAFGSIYKLPVFIDKTLKGKIIFSSGSFTESIETKVTDFIKLEKAMPGNFSVAKKSKVKVKKII